MMTCAVPKSRLPSLNETEPAVTGLPLTVTVAVRVKTVPTAPALGTAAKVVDVGLGVAPRARLLVSNPTTPKTRRVTRL